MKFPKHNIPVLVLSCKLGGLAIMRSLGKLGVSVHGIDTDITAPGLLSRYCKGKHVKSFEDSSASEYLDYVLHIGKKLGGESLLIPTHDELAVFVAEHADQLGEHFIFPKNNLDLINTLVSKEGMYQIALAHNIPTPLTIFPRSLDDVRMYADQVTYPVMLKGIYGNAVFARTGMKMIIVRSSKELIDYYQIMEGADSNDLMIQEYIPGGDDQIFIFNGYFNEKSDCKAAFTGFKVRQYPIHIGSASLGECRWQNTVAETTISFMKAIGYRGILDIGYRLDPRDGRYKVLDINPRVGQAFRLFVAENGLDSVRAAYLDLTGQEVPPSKPKEGRRWLIENHDLVSTLHYWQEGSFHLRDYLKSFKGVEEVAWFCWKDPLPFLVMLLLFIKKTLLWLSKKIMFFIKPKSTFVEPLK